MATMGRNQSSMRASILGGQEYLGAIFYRPLWFIGQFGQIFGLCAVVDYVTALNDERDARDVWKYVGVSIGMFVASMVASIGYNYVLSFSKKAGLGAYTGTAVAVYWKALRLSLTSLNERDTVQERMGNLLVNDSERLFYAFYERHSLWCELTEIIILVGVLCGTLGLTGLFTLIILLLLICAQSLSAAVVAQQVQKATVYADARIQLIGKVLQDAHEGERYIGKTRK